MSADLTPENIMRLGLGFWGSKTLLSAIELGLFTEVARGPIDAETLRERLRLHPRSVNDFLDALVALRMLERDAAGKYRNTPETDLFLDRAKPTYVGGLLEMCNTRLYRNWAGLTEALRTGQPQTGDKDGASFETLYATPEKLETFLSAMTGISLGAAVAIAQKFPWKEYQSFIDVGGAQGALAVQVALAHPHLSGGSFDLAPVRPVFEKYVAKFGLSDRLKFHSGDFFKDPLPKTDVLVMGHVLHDWNLAEKKQILANAFAALPENGVLLVYEALIDDERRENAFGLLMSLNMLIETPGGFDYTGADCQAWMRETGFRETTVEHLVGPDSIVVGIK